MIANSRQKPTVAERFQKKIAVASNGCWLWQGFLDRKGYGRFHVSPDRKAAQAHRVAYEISKGSIPCGLELDHLCRTPACVNPAHLEAVTHAENVRRGPKHKKTHCPRGHELTASNLVPSSLPKEQRCRICHNAVCRAYHRKRRERIERCDSLDQAMEAV